MELRLLLQIEDTTRPTGNPAVNPPNSCVVNNIIHSLFKSVQISLNGTIVSSDDSNYGYKAYFEDVLSHGNTGTKSILKAQAFYPDDYHMDSSTDNENPGIKSRRALFGTYGAYKKVEVISRLHSDICRIDRYLPSGIDVKVSLVKQNPDFYMMGPNSRGVMKILEANISLDHKVINPEVLYAHHSILNTKNMVIPYRKCGVKTYTVTAGLSSVSIDNVVLGRIPNTLIFSMANHTSYNGDRSLNPFNLRHNNIQSFNLICNGEIIPQKPLYFDYHNAKVSTRGYLSLFKALGIANSGSGIIITKERFDNGYFLLAFDLSADNDTTDQCVSTPQEGAISIEFKLQNPLEQPITCLVYTEYDNTLEIDRAKNIFINQ